MYKAVLIVSVMIFSVMPTIFGQSNVLPEFTIRSPEHWINSEPLRKSDLKGKIVFIEIWTSIWINCIRSFPWVHGIEKKYEKQGLKVIAVHSPEFEYEKNRSQVERIAKKYHKTSPIMMDNDYTYWKALGNRYWPTFYLFDQTGQLVLRLFGETHQGSKNALKFEQVMLKLLNKKI